MRMQWLKQRLHLNVFWIFFRRWNNPDKGDREVLEDYLCFLRALVNPSTDTSFGPAALKIQENLNGAMINSGFEPPKLIETMRALFAYLDNSRANKPPDLKSLELLRDSAMWFDKNIPDGGWDEVSLSLKISGVWTFQGRSVPIKCSVHFKLPEEN